ncbi:MAG: histidine phosphatase family protein [Candidatus Dormibacteraceae bacterium]
MIRHGASTWNDERRIQGQLDPPLSESGRDQARRLAARLAGIELDGFYSSDLERALATARTLGAAIGREPELLPGFREIALGEWEGLRGTEIKERQPDLWAQWVANPSWDLVPGGEGTEAFEARVATALAELRARHPSGRVVVVTHGGVIQVALLLALGRGSNGLFTFLIENTSMTVFDIREERTVVAKVNDTGHLD